MHEQGKSFFTILRPERYFGTTNQHFLMSSHAGPYHLFFLFALFYLPSISLSQSCDCPEYPKLRSEYENSETAIEIFTRKLITSGNDICQAKGFEWTAIDYAARRVFDTAEQYFFRAEKKFRESGCGDSVLLFLYGSWAELHYMQGDFPKTQAYCLKLLNASESAGNFYRQAIANTMIAQVLNQTAQAHNGIGYSRKAVALLDKIDDPSQKADLLFKLSKRYLWHYQDTKTKASLDTSEWFSIQQLSIARDINRKNFIASAFGNLEGVAYERGDFTKALSLLDSSFKYTDSDDHNSLGTNFYDKADLYIELKQYKEALRMADSCLYYRKLSGNTTYIGEAYGLLARINEASHDYQKAYAFKELERAIVDSVRNVEKIKAVSELEKKYNQAKNEQTIKELAQQKQIYLLLAIAGLLAAAAIGFYLRQESLKHRQKIMETEQRLNRARMNPHFFFNTLASLQSFALLANDNKLLASHLSKFAHIMRETLENTYKEYVTIEKEIIFLNEYLGLQLIRYPGKFSFTVTADDELERDEILIPAMIIQPFVENSIEHGFAGINHGGEISVRFRRDAGELLIEVTDNGKGLLNDTKTNSGQISRAGQIIQDRLYLLNTKLKSKAAYSISNRPGGMGVIVKIQLPLIERDEIIADR